MSDDTVGAFIPGPRVELPPRHDGPLTGLTFAAKDLFDVAGHKTSYGHPHWAETHPPASGTATAVLALLEAGARLVGKTKTVELAFGLTGENPWHGTPINPAAPDRFPGGSSCGSAAAVAAGLVDIALGSDTGGSVRIPASYCGLFGMRPTLGAVSLAGACGLAPGFDTVGWFARTARLLEAAGDALLPGGGDGAPGPLLKPRDVWANAAPAVAAALERALEKLELAFGPAPAIQAVPEGLDALFQAFRTIQSQEAWTTLGAWIEMAKPELSPAVTERFAGGRAVLQAQLARARAMQRGVQARLRGLLGGGAILVYPTSPCAAPLLTASAAAQQAIREQTVSVTALCGMAGACEVTLPAARVEGAPVGLSLVAAPGRDHGLLALATRAAAVLGLDTE